MSTDIGSNMYACMYLPLPRVVFRFLTYWHPGDVFWRAYYERMYPEHYELQYNNNHDLIYTK